MVLSPKNSKLRPLVVNEVVEHGALTTSNPMVDVSGTVGMDVARINNQMMTGCLVKVVLAGSGAQMIFNLDQVIVNGVAVEIVEVAVLLRMIHLVLLPLLMRGCVARAVQPKLGVQTISNLDQEIAVGVTVVVDV